MKTVLKTYKVTYILGCINPEEKTINIETINSLTEQYIKDEIVRQRPNHKNYIGNILSTILINERVISENKDSEQEKNEIKKMPVFNWGE